ncbi:hypothetical protein [Methylocapsa sp. S129]|uniref:hypothetical protein n=1 Tax=Methylocapsa sp. S129 TaxID=1641869 RepID=UPI00131DEC67|nr:hypothetical protein [Methylocapsa sp. S129]
MPDRRRGMSILVVASVVGVLAAGPAQGKTACAFKAQSADKSARGLALHETPNASAKVLGYISNVEEKDQGPVGASVQVLGAEDGWLLIESAVGKGWVEGRSLTTRLFRETLKAAPDNAAPDLAYLIGNSENSSTAYFEPFTVPVSRIVDCAGPWLEVEIRQPGVKTVAGAPASRDGTVIGWTDRSCPDYDDEGCRLRQFNYPWSPLLAGIAECNFLAYNDDRRGLDVRAEPDANAHIVGRLPAPIKDGPHSGFLSTAQGIGYKDGWFLIEGAPEGEEQFPPETIRFSGRGWVPADRIAVQVLREKLKASPDAGSADVLNLKDIIGEPPDSDVVKPRRVLACSGDWLHVEFARTRGMRPLAKTDGPPDAVRGWAN